MTLKLTRTHLFDIWRALLLPIRSDEGIDFDILENTSKLTSAFHGQAIEAIRRFR